MMQFVDRRGLLMGALATGAISVAALSRTAPRPNVGDILRRCVEVEKRSVGMAAAMVSQHEHQVFCAGRQRLGDDSAVSGDTIFEIASITKVFTALLLANAARRGDMAIDDPVANHLPGSYAVPARDGRPITLVDLATHSSGLPLFPLAFPKAWGDLTSFLRSLAKIGADDLRDWLAGFRLERRPGSKWEYSNTGYALLGLALAHRAVAASVGAR